LCGVEVIDEALREPRAVRSSLVVSQDALWRASETLGAQQPLNSETNSIHAAAWAASDGALRVVREDVGRHNALDKVLGALARSGTDASSGFLVVTSRASYELVQKAAVANVPLLAAVSRPTALAVQLADDAGITLVGLLRGRTANVYTHGARIVL
jgi:FdhD protein